MTTLEVWFETAEVQLPIARIGTAGGELLVEFSQDYLDSGPDLSPIRLPVATTPRLLRWPLRADFGPLPGLLDDTMPDAWGMRVMDRQLAGVGIRQPQLVQRLAWLGDTTMGAISYRPGSRDLGDPIEVDLAITAHAAVGLITGQPEEVLETLARAGGSPGGARPKVLVGIGPDDHLVTGEGALPDGHAPHLVKFTAPTDSPHSGAVEYAYLQVAELAGIEVPAHRLLVDGEGRRHLAVARFDREQVDGALERVHVATASGLLHASHLVPSTDYETLLRLTLRLTGDVRCGEAQMRRAVFNVLAHNRDDHTKQHSFVLRDGGWGLAPAYDLTFSTGAGGEHALAVAGRGTGITIDDLLRMGQAAGLRQAADSIDAVRTALGRWMEVATDAGVPEAEAARIAAFHERG